MNRLVTRQLSTIIGVQTRRIFRIWQQTIIPSAVTAALYFIVFGEILNIQSSHIKAESYTQYIAPGLVMMTIINNSFTNAAFVLFSHKFMRHIEELMVAPISNHTILIGFVTSSMIRSIITGTLVLLVAQYFTPLPIRNPIICIITVLMTASLFSLLGLINGLWGKSFDDMSTIPTFILTPLIYLSGIFYPISALPDSWQTVALLNPIAHINRAFRYCFLSTQNSDIWLTLAIILSFNIVGYITVYQISLNRNRFKID
ncbi:MAG: ABC transporter permease [Legionellales bacterium]|nr:ABC transporter permease [Legionellales bacterium]|tara:strand:+ start:1658 stop:2431 length:774 start_codon:yes stop_codon:yes gene_type:complete